MKIDDYIREYKHRLGCYECGEDNADILVFHHLDPDTKLDDISNLVKRNVSYDIILDEIEKCIVLCWNCHRKLHLELDFENKLGNGYNI